MSVYKASIFNFIYNSINTIIVIVNGIVMVPIYFHYMSVSTYGAWLASGNMVAMLGLLESGFSSVITQKMAAAIGCKDSEAYQYLAGSNIITALIIPIMIFIIGMSLSPFITKWINVSPIDAVQIKMSFIIAVVSSSIAVSVSLFCAFAQVWQKTKVLGGISALTGLFSIACLLCFLINGFGVCSIALSYLVRSLCNLFFQGIWIHRERKRSNILPPLYSIRNSILLTKDCVYPLLSKISGVLMGNSQCFIIAHFMNPGLSAIYDLTGKVCFVAFSFVSQTNGSFFALFSLTLSSGNRQNIDAVFRNTSYFFSISLSIISLYSICFTEPIINYWVGLDKFGGNGLLCVIVLSSVFVQLRSYCNNILYTGGLINKSAMYDILCAIVYILLLLLLIKSLQVLAIPLSLLVVSVAFIVFYLRIMVSFLKLNVIQLVMDFLRSVIIIIPFICIHFIVALDYHNICFYIGYGVVFSVMYFIFLYFTNRFFMLHIISEIFKNK